MAKKIIAGLSLDKDCSRLEDHLIVQQAHHSTKARRLDEAQAVRKPFWSG